MNPAAVSREAKETVLEEVVEVPEMGKREWYLGETFLGLSAFSVRLFSTHL